jgi:long-chain acyl-CoA synthetase
MYIDLELYRKEIPVSLQPLIHLSVIDISPDLPQRTLIFLHGFGGNSIQWRYQLEKFSLANRVIAIDLRGHGQSDRPNSSYSMAEILSDLENALDFLGVAGRFVLIAHSFGGAVATEYANSHPERIERLVLIAAAGEYQLNVFYRIALHLPQTALHLIARFIPKQLGAPPEVLKQWYLHNVSRWNGWSLFRGLNVPTLVIRGHHDRVLEKPMFEEVARAIPHAEEVDVGTSGHMVMLERREAVNRSIERSLTENKRIWREETQSDASERALLRRERPWLAQYDEGVPYTIAVPRVPLSQLMQSAIRRFPNRTALIFEGRRLTYRQLDHEVNRFANALLTLGIEPHDRVMLYLPNLPQFIIAFYGAQKIGAVAVFTLPTSQPAELFHQLQDSGARVVVTLSRFHALARQAMLEARDKLTTNDLASQAGILPSYHLILTDPEDYLSLVKHQVSRLKHKSQTLPRLDMDGKLEEHRLLPLLKQNSKSTPNVDVAPNDLAAILYTGGTTAEPKGVMLSHRNLVANALQTRYWIPQALDGKERFLCILPFAHSYGLTTALNTPISLGATLVLKAKFDIAETLKTIQKLRPTIFPGVPGMYVAINDFPGVRSFGIASIKACISGSAPLPVEVQEAFEKLTRGRLVEGYGLTEAAPVTHANPLSEMRKIGSIGVPLPSTEARLVDLKKGQHPVPQGQIGELAVRGPQVMMGYWQNPEATRQVITPDGWLLTGDIAQMDPDGFFRLIARKADMWYPAKYTIRDRSGKPAFPRDIEEVLFEIPQVREAVVVAIAGQPIAFVIAKQDRPTSETILGYCRRRLPPELVPRLVIFLDDFPRNFIGKVKRRELATRYADQNHRNE